LKIQSRPMAMAMAMAMARIEVIDSTHRLC